MLSEERTNNQLFIRKAASTQSYEVTFVNNDSTISKIGLGDITAPGWHLFTVTFKKGVGGYAYLDGVLKGSVDASKIPYVIPTTIYLGGYPAGSSFGSLIDTVRISSVLRNTDEISTYDLNTSLPGDDSTTLKMEMNDIGNSLNLSAETIIPQSLNIINNRCNALYFETKYILYKQ
jgi:hypothetical protein